LFCVASKNEKRQLLHWLPTKPTNGDRSPEFGCSGIGVGLCNFRCHAKQGCTIGKSENSATVSKFVPVVRRLIALIQGLQLVHYQLIHLNIYDDLQIFQCRFMLELVKYLSMSSLNWKFFVA